MTIDWPSFGLGVLVGAIIGAIAVLVWKQKADQTQLALAWAISVSWLLWHVANGLEILPTSPSATFDIIAGASVGVVIGEKFFEGLKGLRK